MAKKKIVIPMDKEEAGTGGRIRLPEGDYKVKIKMAKAVTSSQKGTPGMQVTFVISEGKHKGKEITDRLWFSPKALYRVRQLLELLELKVPKKVFSVDPDKLRGKELAITVSDADPYEGKISSQVSDYIDLDTYAGDDVDDDEEEDDDDDDDTEDDDDEELDELDVDDDL